MEDETSDDLTLINYTSHEEFPACARNNSRWGKDGEAGETRFDCTSTLKEAARTKDSKTKKRRKRAKITDPH